MKKIDEQKPANCLYHSSLIIHHFNFVHPLLQCATGGSMNFLVQVLIGIVYLLFISSQFTHSHAPSLTFRDPGCASALMIKIPEKNMTFIIFANSDKLSQPFGLRHGNVLNSPAALLFLKSFIFTDHPIKDLQKREVMAKKISEYASGRRPILTLFEKGILACCLLLFLSPLVVWPGAFISRIFSSKKGIRPKAPSKGGILAFFSRIYALTPVGLSILFYGALFQAPFLIYWQNLPGLIDGIPLVQNIFLAFPTIISVLLPALIFLNALVWMKGFWSLFARWHYTMITLSVFVFVIMLIRWHLVGITYYWNILRYLL